MTVLHHAFYLLLTSICLVIVNPSPWQTITEIRLYVLDEQLERKWKAVDVADGLELFRDPWYDPLKPTLLITHGWFQDAEDDVIVMLLDSFFKVKFFEKMNIMVLDAPYFMDAAASSIFYFSSASKITKLGDIIGDVFNKAIEEELIRTEDINLLGLSLGAHLSGQIGRRVKGLVHSIVGLDPAGPGFDTTLQYLTKFRHVSKSDARFVHLYHTNSITFGTGQRLGTADFQFNTGFSQPGCGTSIDPKCSHKRAFYIFNDLILGAQTYIALRCDSMTQLRNCSCEGNPTFVLQYPIDTSPQGKYFLETGYKAPYGLGIKGITCRQDHWDTLDRKEFEKMKTASAMLYVIERFKRNMSRKEGNRTDLEKSKSKKSSEGGQ